MTRTNRIRCDGALRRLDDYLDRELSADEMAMVRSHLALCAACAREFGAQWDVLESIRAKLARIDVPGGVRLRVAMALQRERVAPKRQLG